MFVDDDGFLIPDNLQRGIMGLGEEANDEVAVWGYSACWWKDCRGICGGAGSLMNRKTLIQINEGGNKDKYPTFRDEMDLFHNECGRAGDMTLGRALVDLRNIPIKQFFDGFYVWGFNSDRELFATLKLKDSQAPWYYHYGAKDRFPFVWQKVTEFGSSYNLDD